MNSALRASVEASLSNISDPQTGDPITKGSLQGLTVRENGTVGFVIEVEDGNNPDAEALRLAAEQAALAVEGVTKVTAVLTSQKPVSPRSAARGKSPKPAPAPSASPKGVGAIIAVSSAKGGVGKSSVAVNLAAATSALGLKVGLLDVDVYGPSIPTMMGTRGADPRASDGKKLQPVEAHGIKTMSIGYLADEETPMIWRGPVATSAMMQMLNDVDWAPLDILFLDMPPGTGDIALTMAQRVPLQGAVIVSTPQEVALADVRRGVTMMEKTHTPILGIIENMAWLEVPDGQRMFVFGEGGARKTAESLNVNFLGEVPLITSIREGADRGVPSALADGSVMNIFRAIAENMLSHLEIQSTKPPPVIRFT